MRSPSELTAISYRFLEKPHLLTRLEERLSSRAHRESRATRFKEKGLDDHHWYATHKMGTAESRKHIRRGNSLFAKYEIMVRRLDTTRFPR